MSIISGADVAAAIGLTEPRDLARADMCAEASIAALEGAVGCPIVQRSEQFVWRPNWRAAMRLLVLPVSQVAQVADLSTSLDGETWRAWTYPIVLHGAAGVVETSGAWPIAYYRATITWGLATSEATVPAPLRHAALALAANLWRAVQRVEPGREQQDVFRRVEIPPELAPVIRRYRCASA